MWIILFWIQEYFKFPCSYVLFSKLFTYKTLKELHQPNITLIVDVTTIFSFLFWQFWLYKSSNTIYLQVKWLSFSSFYQKLLKTPLQHLLYIREPSNSTLSASSCAPLKTSYQGQENSIKGAILVSKCTDHLRSWKFNMFVKSNSEIFSGKLTL